ncbi:MAG: hypothetical protein Q4A06_02780 [Cardiobacteriaceae bacterium]|nr:hypothetical protein [Cardiobacteriaceae bacterium]
MQTYEDREIKNGVLYRVPATALRHFVVETVLSLCASGREW